MLKKLIGFNGIPILELEDIIQAPDYTALHEEVCAGLTLSTQLRAGSGGIFDSEDEGSSKLKLPGQLKDLFAGLSAKQLTFLKSLNPAPIDYENFEDDHWYKLTRQQHQYLKYASGLYFSWQNNITLISPSNLDNWWSSAHQVPGKIDPETQKLFPLTLNFIKTALPFQHIGRALVFGNDPLTLVPTHRDLDDYYDGEHYAEFMNFCIAPVHKKFYVFDNSTRTKHYPKGRFYWFNELDYHGADPMPFFNYSLRVDGQFTEEFREKIKQKYKGFEFRSAGRPIGKG